MSERNCAAGNKKITMFISTMTYLFYTADYTQKFYIRKSLKSYPVQDNLISLTLHPCGTIGNTLSSLPTITSSR